MIFSTIIDNIAHSGSTQLLARLFGGDVYNIFGSGSFNGPHETMLTLYGTILVHSGIVSFLFIALVLYITVSGLIHKSHDGTFMIRNSNGFWPSLRVIFGTTAVVPSLSMKNLVGIQVVVIAIALMSSSVADLTWKDVLNTSAKYGLSVQHVLTPNIDQSKTDAYLNDAFKYSACLANKIKFNNTGHKVDLDSIDPIKPGTTEQGRKLATKCAGKSFLEYMSRALVAQPPEQPDLTPKPGEDLIDSEQMAKFNKYQSEQFDYLEGQTVIDFIRHRVWPFYVNNIDAINGGVVPSSLADSWNNILDSFHTTLKDKIKSAVISNKTIAANVFASQVSKYGWISAANYYKQLAGEQQIINGQINSALQRSPNFVDLYKQHDLTNADSITKFHIKKAEGFIGKAEDYVASGAKKYIVDPLGVDFLKMGDETDPFLAMTNFGLKLEGLSEMLVVLRQTPVLLDKIPLVGHLLAGKVSNTLSGGVMDFLLFALTVCGMILGVVLPNLPWIFFMLAIISWIIHVAEMYIAAPFWVVANAFPEGNTFLSHVAKKGVNNVMFIALFPVLAIGGLVASISISWIGISLLNHFAYLSLKGMSGWTLPFNVVGIVIIYTVLAWTVMMNSMGLIQMFPRTILNWISLSQPGMNQFSSAHTGVKDTLVNIANPSQMTQRGSAFVKHAESSRAISQASLVSERSLQRKRSLDDAE